MSRMIDALTRPSITNQPPSKEEIRRNDISVLVWVLFVLLLGIVIRNSALNASETRVLGEGLPTIQIPAGWSTGQSDDVLLRARNLSSPSSFDAEISLTARSAKQEETLTAARNMWAVRRNQELDRYRELTAEQVEVLGGTPATIVTYAYIADPARDVGALGPLVVVQGKDLIFLTGDQVVVVSVAADASMWDDEQRDFDIVFNSLRLKEGE